MHQETTHRSSVTSSRIISAIVGVVMLVLTFLQIHNISLYPIKKGFDGLDHLQYVHLVTQERRVPLANEGWEMYQPPLYYFAASVLPTTKAVQYIGFLVWLGFCLLSYIFVRKQFAERSYAYVAMFLIASLPMALYMTPMVSNEFFSGLVMSIVLVYHILCFDSEGGASRRSGVILGLLLGLALLSKATSIVLAVSIFADVFVSQKFDLLKTVHRLRWVLVSAFVVSGWFYIRNLYYFGNPVASSVDFLPSTVFTQDPGFRDLRFFLDPMGFLKLDISYAHHYSLWAGTYFSWFYDGHHALLPVQEFSKAGIALVVASAPITLLTIRGVMKAWGQNGLHRILLIYPGLLFLAYIAYNFRLPYYSTVKAIFLTSTLIPWVYYTIYGLHSLPKKWYVQWAVVGFMAMYGALVVKNFWIITWWYNHLK